MSFEGNQHFYIVMKAYEHIPHISWKLINNFSKVGMMTKKNKLHRLSERDSRLAHHFGPFCGLWLLLWYLATSSAKSDAVFLLGDADFL